MRTLTTSSGVTKSEVIAAPVLAETTWSDSRPGGSDCVSGGRVPVRRDFSMASGKLLLQLDVAEPGPRQHLWNRTHACVDVFVPSSDLRRFRSSSLASASSFPISFSSSLGWTSMVLSSTAPSNSAARDYMTSTDLLPTLEAGIEVMLKECSGEAKRDPINFLASWLMRNNPKHNEAFAQRLVQQRAEALEASTAPADAEAPADVSDAPSAAAAELASPRPEAKLAAAALLGAADAVVANSAPAEAAEPLSAAPAEPKPSGRGRSRRPTKEHMLSKESLTAGTDEWGVRIRIFTAALTCERACRVGIMNFTYTGETIASADAEDMTVEAVTDAEGLAGRLACGRSRHGQGEITYDSGAHYAGGWERGKRSGHGRMAFPHGDSYGA